MTSSNNQPASGRPARRPDSGLSYIPPAWLAFVVAWSVYSMNSAWPLTSDYGLPDSVYYLIYGSLAASIVIFLWGLFVLGLAFNRSARFPRHFTLWQVATILWLLARQSYILVTPDFVFSARGLAVTGAEIAVGLLCIYLLRRGSGADAVYANSETERPPVLASIIATLLGVILGAALGACAGFFGGLMVANLTDMSCFEGACAYFALFVGLAGLVVGAVAGGVFAVWRVNRRKLKPAA
jgi:hypothetical protein